MLRSNPFQQLVLLRTKPLWSFWINLPLHFSLLVLHNFFCLGSLLNIHVAKICLFLIHRVRFGGSFLAPWETQWKRSFWAWTCFHTYMVTNQGCVCENSSGNECRHHGMRVGCHIRNTDLLWYPICFAVSPLPPASILLHLVLYHNPEH